MFDRIEILVSMSHCGPPAYILGMGYFFPACHIIKWPSVHMHAWRESKSKYSCAAGHGQYFILMNRKLVIDQQDSDMVGTRHPQLDNCPEFNQSILVQEQEGERVLVQKSETGTGT